MLGVQKVVWGDELQVKKEGHVFFGFKAAL